MFIVFPISVSIRISEDSVMLGRDAGPAAFILCFAIHLLPCVRQRTHGSSEDVSLPRIIARLPHQMQAPMVRMTVSDHYVEVYTEKGSHKILMRLRDACLEAEADGLNGFCVHRSHWVMHDAISHASRSGGREFLYLKDGTPIPIGRKYRHNVEAAGFL